MASDKHMPGPVCLIENTDTQLVVNPEALKILSAITQPVVVVAIVGLYRTGKSYLMNKLAGQKKGFSLGSTVQSHTKGIWMWCLPHPKEPNYTLVLLDTEGMGNVEKNSNKSDSWIFALAILLSSTFVYNTMGTINQQAMDQLHYVTELTDKIKAKSSPGANEDEDSADFVSFFPDFVWTLRDFPLELEVDGQPISADEYLQNSLKLKQGTSPKDEKFNLPRVCIQKFFPKKKCFIFDQPTHRKKLGQLETMHDDELDPEFVQQAADFCSYIFTNSKVKTLSGGIQVNGPRLKTLLMTYVDTISSGDLPCMENAVLALAQIENSAAVKKAIAHYDQQMGEKVELPTETLRELLDLHTASGKEANEVFMKNSFKNVDHLFLKELESEEVLQTYLNSKESVIDAILQTDQNLTVKEKEIEVQRVKAEFAEAAAEMLEEMHKKNQRMMEESKKSFQEHVKQLIEKMEQERALLKADQRRAMATILQTDQTLTVKEKEIEVQRVKAESAEAKAKMLEEMLKKNQQMMEEKEKSYQEHVKQLIEKMEQERAQIMAELKRARATNLQTDQTFTIKEKKIEVQPVKAESAEAAAKMQEEMQKKNQQMMEESKKSFQEHVKQLIEKMEQERAQLKAEQRRAMATILQTDQTLTEKEKEIEVQPMKAEFAETAAKMLEEMQKKNQQMMEEKEKSYQEHVKQLIEKMEQKRAQLMAEQERTMALKLEEQTLLLKEGFQNKSRQLQREIDNLKEIMAIQPQNPCAINLCPKGKRFPGHSTQGITQAVEET